MFYVLCFMFLLSEILVVKKKWSEMRYDESLVLSYTFTAQNTLRGIDVQYIYTSCIFVIYRG
jgi:hypothetical protein